MGKSALALCQWGHGRFVVNSRPGEHLLVALRRILRPIVGILIRAGIRFEEFSDVARGVFVESAIRDGLDHREQHDSRARFDGNRADSPTDRLLPRY